MSHRTRTARSTCRPLEITAGLLIAFAAACSDGGGATGVELPDGSAPVEVEPIRSLPRALSAAEIEVIRGSNRFAIDLALEVSRSDPAKSFFISPLSASMALGMTMNGAAGDTWDEMRQVLGFEGLTQEEINASYRGLLDLLLGLDATVETVISNAAWIRSGFPVFDSFRDILTVDFDARVEALDFADPSSVDVINDWASEATKGRITEIVRPPLPPGSVLFLMNALFFKASWRVPFDPGVTRPQPFHLADGSAVEVDMMFGGGVADRINRLTDVDYDYVAADLPYGGGAFSMTIVVPKPELGVDGLLGTLDARGWDALVQELEPEERIQVVLPRFTMDFERSLGADLARLGMGSALAPETADFSRLSSAGGVFIDQIKQKAFVQVDEQGTEAAAVTSVGIGVISAPPTLRADRPFLFAIRERFSGTILFLGAVVEPPEG